MKPARSPAAADDLSRRTEKQAATLEETAAALDELTDSVRSAAEGADARQQDVEQTPSSNAEQGGGGCATEAVTRDGRDQNILQPGDFQDHQRD